MVEYAEHERSHRANNLCADTVSLAAIYHMADEYRDFLTPDWLPVSASEECGGEGGDN